MAKDHAEELGKITSTSDVVDWKGRRFTLREERFKIGEVLFQPNFVMIESGSHNPDPILIDHQQSGCMHRILFECYLHYILCSCSFNNVRLCSYMVIYVRLCSFKILINEHKGTRTSSCTK